MMAPSPCPRPPSYSIKHTPVQPSGCPNTVEPILIKRNYNDFSILKFLSIGDHGTFYLARDVNTGREYALKVISKDTVSPVQAFNEARLQTLIATDEDSFLLPLKATWHDTQNYYLVTDFMPGGDLAAQLAGSDSPFDEDHTRFYGAEMIMIVEELRKHRLIHRDIKPSNLLVDSQGHLCLTGFRNAIKFEAPQEYEALDSIHASLSFEVDPNSESGAFFLDMPTPEFKTSEICGTPGFMSPQRTKGEPYGDEEDLWSVGVVLYLMLTGRMPFGNDYEGRPEIAFCVLRKDVLFKPTDLISDNARSLLVGMLAKDTRTRLSMEQIKRHAFFKGIDWELVRRHGCPAPWVPPPTYSPRFPTYISPIVVGIPYKPWNDPLPEYSYTSPRMNEPKPYPTEVQKTPSEKLRMAMARVLGLDDTVDFRHDTEEHSEEDEDDTWFAYEEDDEHLPIQYIDYSELPFGSHPLDRKLGLDFVFDFEEPQSLTAESQDDDTQTITREVYLRDSWFAALAELGRAEQDVSSPPAATIRAQTLPTVYDSEKDGLFSADRQSFPSFADVSTPSYPSTQGRISVQPGSVVPPSFYQHFSHGFETQEAQPEPQQTPRVKFIADSYEVDNSSPFEADQGFEGLMLFVMDMDQVIPLPEKNLYENPRSAPIPPAALPLSPTSTLFPELGSPSIPDRQSITTSGAPWQSVPKVDFFEKYRNYRLNPKHILARRALAARTIEPLSLTNQAAARVTTRSQSIERRNPNLHRGLSRLPALATETSINVEADMDQDVQLASKKRGSVELLRSFVEDTTSEEETRLPSALSFFRRVRGKLTGGVAGSGGGAFGVITLAATSQNTGSSVSSKTEATCYN